MNAQKNRDRRRHLWAAARGACHCCGGRVPLDAATIDHVTPRAKGGTDCWANMVISCKPCNEAKGTMTVAEFAASRKGRAA